MNEKKRANTIHGLRILAVIMLIVCVVTVSLCYLASSRNGVAVLGETQNAEPSDQALIATPEPISTPKPVIKTESTSGADGNIAIPGWKEITIDADSTVVSVPFNNPSKNIDYALSFSILIPNSTDNGYDTIYESLPISAGERIEKIELTKALPAGRYEKCLIHIQPYSIPEMTELNNVDIELAIISK